MNENVYFIASNGLIKIGYSGNVRNRLQELSRMNAAELTLIGSVRGSMNFEKALHEAAAAHRTKGEWFLDCAEVRDLIARVMQHGYEAIGFVEPPPRRAPQMPPQSKRKRKAVSTYEPHPWMMIMSQARELVHGFEGLIEALPRPLALKMFSIIGPYGRSLVDQFHDAYDDDPDDISRLALGWATVGQMRNELRAI